MSESAGKFDSAVSFESFYDSRYREISAYVRRRLPEQESLDVIAQVFAVAWRRYENVPAPPEDRLWLFGVARRAVAEHRRARWRRLRLHDRLVGDLSPVSDQMSSPDPLHAGVAAAMERLRPRDREVLQLVLWEDLTHAEAASVLGCSVNAVELRFRHAQERIRKAFGVIPVSVDRPDMTATSVERPDIQLGPT